MESDPKNNLDIDVTSKNIFKAEGLGVAVVTPFDNNKKIDFRSLDNLINYLISEGTDYLVVLGTTSEAPTLSIEEKNIVKQHFVDHVNGRLPLVLGLGGNCTASVVEEIKKTDLGPYSAILSVTPYYNKPNQKGLLQHFSIISEISPIPVILYNVPGRTSVNLEYETTLELAYKFDNIIGIKEASGNRAQIDKLFEFRPSNFKILSGDDSLTCYMMKKGGEGVISVIGNAFPRRFGKMVRLLKEKRFEEALNINSTFKNLYSEIFKEGNPSGIKCLLHLMGLITNELRLPLVPVSKETENSLAILLNSFSSSND